jgi:hypothetical protein
MSPAKPVLSAPVGNGAPIDLSQQLLEADAVVRRISSSYVGMLQGDLCRMRECLTAAQDAGNVAGNLTALFDIAHDVKGQGGTFGYPLISQIAEALCRYLAAALPQNIADLSIVEVHLDAITTVARHQIIGDGGVIGADIVRSLGLLQPAIAAKPGAEA